MIDVLIVEDDPRIRANLLFQLQDLGHRPSVTDSAEQALAWLDSQASRLPGLLLVDVRLPGMSGVDLVRRLAESGRLPPTIIVSGEASIAETVEALKLGVHDFVEKPFSTERLRRSIENTLEHTDRRDRVQSLESELRARSELIGQSAVMKALRESIAKAAPTDARVLILGESGTGKELVADALHLGSPRSSQAFIKINCAAIPADLVEDELFGHVKGAFTGAVTEKRGLFEEADGGTLFLDEIGDMDYRLQSRLLRVLEDGKVRRVGETKDREVDVRVLAATHEDLEEGVREKSFRQDLYFRLAHLPITVPPLRERTGDVRLLFEHFLKLASQRHRMRRRVVDEAVYPLLDAYSWPGNVRELESLAERLVVFGSDPVSTDQLPAGIRDPSAAGPIPASADPFEGPIQPFRRFKELAEERYIRRVLAHTDWNVTAAARLLELQRTHLHQKMASLSIVRPRHRPSNDEAENAKGTGQRGPS